MNWSLQISVICIFIIVQTTALSTLNKHASFNDVEKPSPKDLPVLTNDIVLDRDQVGPRPCPCLDSSMCLRIKGNPKHEVFIFSVNPPVNFLHYDWTKVTTVAIANYRNDSLMCYAHSKGARVVSLASIPTDQLTNATARSAWVQRQIQDLKTNFFDGVNVDYESEIDQDQVAVRDGLTALVRELSAAAKTLDANIQITVDFAWNPDGVDSRWYDYKGLAEVADFVFIMSYDERSQIRGACVAWANSAYNNTRHGLQQYLALGIPSNKLVLGIPWYGYRYPCIAYDKTTHTCHITPIPFRGVNCSDAAGRQITYGAITNQYLAKSFTGRLWDLSAESPYFDFEDPSTSQIYQFRYDDPESLAAKYRLVGELSLRGIGMWNADQLDYTNRGQVADMWGILPG